MDINKVINIIRINFKNFNKLYFIKLINVDYKLLYYLLTNILLNNNPQKFFIYFLYFLYFLYVKLLY